MRWCLHEIKKCCYQFAALFCWEFFYRILSSVIILKSARVLFIHILKKMGYSYLTAENYQVFISNPYTIAALLFYGCCIIMLLFFEFCLISQTIHDKKRNADAKLRYSIKKAFLQMIEMLKDQKAGCIVLTVCTSIFACTHYMIREIFEIKIISYAFEKIYNWKNMSYFMIVLGVLLIIFSLLGMYSFPVLFEEDKKWKDWKEVWKESCRIFLKNQKQSIAGLILINGLITVIIIIIYYVHMVLYAWILTFFVKTKLVMTTLFAINDAVTAMIGFLSGLFGIICNMVFIYRLYLGQSSKREMRIHYGIVYKKEDKKFPVYKIVMLLLLIECVYLYSSILSNAGLKSDMYMGVQVTAHRGGALDAPENTLAALQTAMEHHADYCEIDIQETQDGVLVLLHDTSLKRTTGFSKRIWDTSYEQVRLLDAGKFFSEEYTYERIPSLQEAFELCKGHMNFNIEIKYNGHNPDIVQKVVGLIEEMEMQAYCVITSMNYQFLKEVKQLNPDIRTGYIISVAYGNVEALEWADFLSVKSDCVTKQFMDRVHAAGKEVHVWTVNSRREMRRMIALKVDNIITDRPAVAREIIAEDYSESGFLEILRLVLE